MKISFRFLLAVLIGIASILPIGSIWTLAAVGYLLFGGELTLWQWIYTLVPPLLFSSLISFLIAGPTRKERVKAAIFTIIGIIVFITVWMLARGTPAYLYVYNIIFYEIPHLFSH